MNHFVLPQSKPSFSYLIVDDTSVRSLAGKNNSSENGAYNTKNTLNSETNTQQRIFEIANWLNELAASHKGSDQLFSDIPKPTAEQNQLLQELDHEKTLNKRILRNVQHELRTPLVALVSLTEVVAQDWEHLTDEEKQECMKLIHERGRSLHRHIENMLTLNESLAHSLNMQLRPVCLKTLIQDLLTKEVSYLKSYLPLKVNLEVAGSDSPVIYADEAYLSNVLSELLSNALRYTKEGTITLTLKSSEIIYQNGYSLPAWAVEVADTGIGVPEAELEQIFMPFYESTRTRSKAGGRGLGLAVAKAVIEAHYGQIEAFNNDTQGLTVRCHLPRMQPVHQVKLEESTHP